MSPFETGTQLSPDLQAQIDRYIEARIEAQLNAKVAERLAHELKQALPAQTTQSDMSGVIASLEQQLARIQTQISELAENQLQNRLSILVFSGEMDKLFCAYVIATTAAAMGMDVTMFFSFWGLTAIKKERLFEGKTLPARLMAGMMPANASQAGTSHFNFMGLGPQFLNLMMKQSKISTLPELMTLAQELGIRRIACRMSMDVMGISPQELQDDLEYAGAAAYLEDAASAKMSLMI